jgi:hypothetical protein
MPTCAKCNRTERFRRFDKLKEFKRDVALRYGWININHTTWFCPVCVKKDSLKKEEDGRLECSKCRRYKCFELIQKDDADYYAEMYGWKRTIRLIEKKNKVSDEPLLTRKADDFKAKALWLCPDCVQIYKEGIFVEQRPKTT